MHFKPLRKPEGRCQQEPAQKPEEKQGVLKSLLHGAATQEVLKKDSAEGVLWTPEEAQLGAVSVQGRGSSRQRCSHLLSGVS